MSKKIFHVGPDMASQGGIASVIRFYRSHGYAFEPEFTFGFIATYNFKRKINVLKFLKTVWFFLVSLRKAHLYHFHVASGFSFYRKSILCLMSILFNKQYILHVHGGGFVDFYTKCNGLCKWFVRFLISKSAATLTVSETFRGRLVKELGLKRQVCVVNNCSPDLEKETYAESMSVSGEFVILYMGRLSEQKGLLDLLSAYQIVLQKYRRIGTRLIVAGDGELSYWKSKAKELGILDSIEFVGWVSGSEKKELLEKASVFCSPSYVESFGISVLEAMLMAKPIVCSRIDGLVDLVDNETGILVEAGNIEVLADSLNILIEDGKLLRKLSVSAFFKSHQMFSSSESIRLTKQIYHSCFRGCAQQ